MLNITTTISPVHVDKLMLEEMKIFILKYAQLNNPK